MPEFNYVARTPGGERKEGQVSANDRATAVRKLQSTGHIVLSISEVVGGVGPRRSVAAPGEKVPKVKIVKRKSALKNDDLIQFFDHLSVLLDSSVDIIRSLEIIAMQVSSQPLFDSILSIKTDIAGGVALSSAMAKYPKIFPAYMNSIILIGEQSGELPTVLDRLAKNLERAGDVNRKIVKALIYPAILMGMSIFAIFVFLLKIIPMFTKIFAEFDVELPAITKMVVRASDFVRSYFFIEVAVIVAVVFVVRQIWVKPTYRYIFDKKLLNIPILGPLLMQSSVVNFTTSLSLMLENGVILLEALDLSVPSLKNLYLEGIMDRIKDRVREGETLSVQLEKVKIFPPILVQMVGVGEETGRLGLMLNKIAGFYDKRVTESVDKLATVMEPLILIFVGAVVSVLVIAMFLPIFKMASIGGG